MAKGFDLKTILELVERFTTYCDQMKSSEEEDRRQIEMLSQTNRCPSTEPREERRPRSHRANREYIRCYGRKWDEEFPKLPPPLLSFSPSQPPIRFNVTSDRQFHRLRHLIRRLLSGVFSMTINEDLVQVYTKSPEDYSVVIRALKEKDVTFSEVRVNYDTKKLVVRGLPVGMDPIKIFDSFETRGVKITAIKPVLSQRPPYLALPLYKVYRMERDISRLERIKSIGRYPVTLELLRRLPGPPQCHRCQALGHRTNTCALPARCVKCAGRHSSRKCNKSPVTPATCANCDGPHTASYRGCSVQKAARIKPPHTLIPTRT